MYITGITFSINRSFMGLERVKKWMDVNKSPTPLPDEEWYFLKYLVDNDISAFDYSQDIKKEIMNLVMENTINLLLKFKEKKIHDLIIKSLLSHLDIKFSTQKKIFIHEDPFGIIVQINKSNILIISNNNDNVKQITEKLHQAFMRYSDEIKEFGYTLGYFISGKNLVEKWLVDKKNVAEIKILKPKNKLENKVINYIKKYTDSFLSNIEIKFIEPVETFEYDIILELPNIFLNIEIMDYSSIKDEIYETKKATPLFIENIKSTTLLKSIDKANKLDLKLIIVMSGFPNDVLKNIKTIASSRGITIIEANSLNNLSKIIMEQVSQIITSKEKTLGNELKKYFDNEDIKI